MAEVKDAGLRRSGAGITGGYGRDGSAEPARTDGGHSDYRHAYSSVRYPRVRRACRIRAKDNTPSYTCRRCRNGIGKLRNHWESSARSKSRPVPGWRTTCGCSNPRPRTRLWWGRSGIWSRESRNFRSWSNFTATRCFGGFATAICGAGTWARRSTDPEFVAGPSCWRRGHGAGYGQSESGTDRRRLRVTDKVPTCGW